MYLILAKLKVCMSCLFSVLEVWNVKRDLFLGCSLKVKQGQPNFTVPGSFDVVSSGLESLI